MKTSEKLLKSKILNLREKTPNIKFDPNQLAEIEINKFFYNHRIVDRIMIVLRANGCEHYKKNGGCAMCAHFNGVDRNYFVKHENYVNQWNTIKDKKINLNDYEIACIYNLGSFFNEREIDKKSVKYILDDLNNYKKIKKIIIESRAEYVNEDIVKFINNIYKTGIIEVGIGVESTNKKIRNLCHHKGLESLEEIKKAVKTLHKFGNKALAYVNLKPAFLTETEAIEDAVKTCVDCFKMGFDAISIEPTSLQNFSLTNYLYEIGEYRVPWLWSVREVVEKVYETIPKKNLDIRIGGYFDEEVLSGSQGVGYEGRNELFPSTTSLNCPYCSEKFIEGIKRFNQTYKVTDLYNINNCPYCYHIWEDTKQVKDSRTIEQRIEDIIGNKEV